jgi:hypothetical protein
LPFQQYSYLLQEEPRRFNKALLIIGAIIAIGAVVWFRQGGGSIPSVAETPKRTPKKNAPPSKVTSTPARPLPCLTLQTWYIMEGHFEGIMIPNLITPYKQNYEWIFTLDTPRCFMTDTLETKPLRDMRMFDPLEGTFNPYMHSEYRRFLKKHVEMTGQFWPAAVPAIEATTLWVQVGSMKEIQ